MGRGNDRIGGQKPGGLRLHACKRPTKGDAAEYHQWMKQAAVPTSTGYNPNPVRQFDLNKYWKNPVSAARNEAMNALNDLRKPQRPIGL